jgi:hypothetical protein
MENINKVSKRQWKKWNETEQTLFNDLYEVMLYNQSLFNHPLAFKVNGLHWETTAWNAAWMAADLLRSERKRG